MKYYTSIRERQNPKCYIYVKHQSGKGKIPIISHLNHLLFLLQLMANIRGFTKTRNSIYSSDFVLILVSNFFSSKLICLTCLFQILQGITLYNHCDPICKMTYFIIYTVKAIKMFLPIKNKLD